MRSDWTGDAACAGFRVSPAYTKTSHGDFDVNTFILYRKGVLSPDSGIYDINNGQLSYTHYQKNTVAHNNLLIVDPNNPNNPTKLSGGVADPGGTELITTRTFGLDYGRGLQTIFLHNASAEWGDITRVEQTADYDYVVGEAPKAYGSRLSEYSRNIVFIRNGTKAYFVAFDRVNSTNANFQKKWLMHFVTEPLIDGNKVSEEVANHIDTYDGSLTRSANINGTSSIFCKTLMPDVS